MTQKTENTGATDGNGSDNQEVTRPDNVPEQFWNAETKSVDTEKLLAFHAEATKPTDTPAPKTEDEVPEAPIPAHKAKYDAAVVAATEALTNGTELTDDIYEQFAEAGVTRAQVDDYIEGRQAVIEIRTQRAHQLAGGADEYAEMVTWGAQNYESEEIEAFNAAVFGKDSAAAEAALTTLKERYVAVMGNEGTRVAGTGNTNFVGGFQSKEEWMAEVRKPEYKKDPAFRAKVEAKLSKTDPKVTGISVSIR